MEVLTGYCRGKTGSPKGTSWKREAILRRLGLLSPQDQGGNLFPPDLLSWVEGNTSVCSNKSNV